MHILHLVYDHIQNPVLGGGSAIRTHEVYRRLAGEHQVEVVCGRWPGAPSRQVQDGVSYRHVGPSGPLGVSRAGFGCWMNWLAARARYDLLVVDISPFMPCAAPRLTSRPVVGLVQSWADADYAAGKAGLVGRGALRVRDWTLRTYPLLITVSPSVQEALREIVGPRTEVACVPNGVDSSLLEVVPAEPEGPPYFLFLGRLEAHVKGLDLLLEAFNSLHRRHAEARLVIAGSGPDEAALRQEVQRRGLEGAVEFVGRVAGQRKADLLGQCLALAMSSRRESWGLTAMEAQACAKPVVGFEVPGVRDAVRQGETGLLVPAYDTEALSQAMARLLGDPALRRRLGTAGRERARGFTWEQTARQQVALYEKLLHNR